MLFICPPPPFGTQGLPYGTLELLFGILVVPFRTSPPQAQQMLKKTGDYSRTAELQQECGITLMSGAIYLPPPPFGTPGLPFGTLELPFGIFGVPFRTSPPQARQIKNQTGDYSRTAGLHQECGLVSDAIYLFPPSF